MFDPLPELSVLYWPIKLITTDASLNNSTESTFNLPVNSRAATAASMLPGFCCFDLEDLLFELLFEFPFLELLFLALLLLPGEDIGLPSSVCEIRKRTIRVIYAAMRVSVILFDYMALS